MRKKKDNGLRAVICLAVATVAVGAASIAVSNMEKSAPDVVSGKNLDITGASKKIKEAKQNEDGTYTVVVAENGYVGEMIISVTYSADGQNVISYDVLSHTETDNIGSKVDEDAYKTALAGTKLPMTTAGLDISGILGIEQEVTKTEDGALENGTHTAKTETTETGDYNYVTITVEDGKITNVVWDEITGGASKAELAANGQYVMVEGNPTWKDQSEALGAYVVKNQTTDGIMNETGYTDAVSGVSIYVGGFVDITNQALAQASVEGELPQAATPQVDATMVDVVTGATFSSKAVIRAINEGFVYLRDFILK